MYGVRLRARKPREYCVHTLSVWRTHSLIFCFTDWNPCMNVEDVRCLEKSRCTVCFLWVSFRPPPPLTVAPIISHPQLWLITDQVQQSQIRSDTTKRKVLGWCPESAVAAGFAATAESARCRWQPRALAGPLSKNPIKSLYGYTSTAMQPYAQEGSGPGRKHTTSLFSFIIRARNLAHIAQRTGVMEITSSFHAPFFCHVSCVECANTWC